MKKKKTKEVKMYQSHSRKMNVLGQWKKEGRKERERGINEKKERKRTLKRKKSKHKSTKKKEEKDNE